MTRCLRCGYADDSDAGTDCPVPDCPGKMTGTETPVDAIRELHEGDGTPAAPREDVEQACGTTAVNHYIQQGDIYPVGDELRVTRRRPRPGGADA